MLEQIHCALAARLIEAWLQCQHLAHGDRKSSGNGNAPLLLRGELVGSKTQRLRLGHFFPRAMLCGDTPRWRPEEYAQQKHRIDRLAACYPLVGVF